MAKFLWRGVKSGPAANLSLHPLVLCFTLVLLPVLLAGCGNSGSTPDPGTSGSAGAGRLRVVATTGMIADAAVRVGGERVQVEALMGPGVDPHLYKASEGDVRRLSDADVIFYNGLHLEAKMGDVLEKMGKSRRVVAVAEAIDSGRLISAEEVEGAQDPHVWFDVELWSQAVAKIQSTLAEADAAGAETYKAQGEAYLKELADLHRYAQERCQAVPQRQRVLITAHDAFNYFGRAYGFEVRGLQGISTAAEAGAGDVNALAAFIAERKIPAIFVESSVPRRNIEAVQEAVKARGFTVNIGGELFSDALGDAGTSEGTYLGMVRHNIDTITSALGAK